MDQGVNMKQSTYMLRSARTSIWHLPSAPEQTQWKTLCTMPIHGKEERLLPPNQPQGRDVVCPKCQQIERAQARKEAKAVEAAKLTNPD
jgi:hypothetical protein